MFAKMDNNPPISAGELQIEFDRLKEVFRGDNSFAKFEASVEMMVLISHYLSNNIASNMAIALPLPNASTGPPMPVTSATFLISLNIIAP